MGTICRWGILSTAGIARKNWSAIRLAPNATLQAVASRSAESAQSFIDECQSGAPFECAPEAVEGYEALLARDDIDAVYIPLPTGIRKEWIIRAAEAGKHVIGEKPSAVSVADLNEILDVCKQNNVQYMDGVMFMHSDRLQAMGACLKDGESVGDIRRIASHHTFAADDDFLQKNIRLNSALEPQGALGDLGWYSIRYILWALDWKLPSYVTGATLTAKHRADSDASVPLEFSGEMFYENTSASFYCSFITENQQWVNVGGSKGFLKVTDFVLPFYGNELHFDVSQAIFNIDGCQFNMEQHTRTHSTREYANNSVCAQETRMIENFSRIALSGSLDDSWTQIAMATQQVMDACLESANHDGRKVAIHS